MNKVELTCSCGNVLIRLGGGARIAGITEIRCQKCGERTQVNAEELTRQAAALPETGGSALVQGQPNGRLTVRGADGAPGKSGGKGGDGGGLVFDVGEKTRKENP